MSKHIYLAPDTNVLMQCLHLAELPWKKEFPGFDSICLVLVAPVLREVDRQKGGQGRLAKRARIINGLIGKLLDSAAVDISKGGSPSVRLTSREELRPDPEMEESLDYTQADDAIVGTVSALLKGCDDGGVVKLLSNDNGVLLTARRVGVPFHRVPPEWLLSAESDEEQKKTKALESEIRRLKNSEPACVVQASELPWKFSVDRFEPLMEAQIAELLVMLQSAFPEATDFGQREISTRSSTPGQRGIFAHFGKEEFVPATEGEIREYQQERYPQWISSCEKYLKDVHHKLEKRLPAPRILIELINEGTRPAEDVRVAFSIRGGGLLIKLPEKVDEESAADLVGGIQMTVSCGSSGIALPRPPSAPKGHWKQVKAFAKVDQISSIARMVSTFDPLTSPAHRIVGPVFQPTRDSDAFYWRSGRRPMFPLPSTELTCQQWRHRSIPESFEFEVVWLGGVESRKGAIHVEIHAANLTDPVTKTIPIQVTAQVGDTWGEAQALIELLKVPTGLLRLPRA
ncbi:PIN domain-containing protein [Stenotrophomonas rhizophila]